MAKIEIFFIHKIISVYESSQAISFLKLAFDVICIAILFQVFRLRSRTVLNLGEWQIYMLNSRSHDSHGIKNQENQVKILNYFAQLTQMVLWVSSFVFFNLKSQLESKQIIQLGECLQEKIQLLKAFQMVILQSVILQSVILQSLHIQVLQDQYFYFAAKNHPQASFSTLPYFLPIELHYLYFDIYLLFFS